MSYWKKFVSLTMILTLSYITGDIYCNGVTILQLPKCKYYIMLKEDLFILWISSSIRSKDYLSSLNCPMMSAAPLNMNTLNLNAPFRD